MELCGIMRTEDIDFLIKEGVLDPTTQRLTSRAISILKRNSDIAAVLLNATSYCPDGTPYAQRVWCLTRGYDSFPVCNSCSAPVKFNSTIGFSTFCSTKCSNSSPQKIAQIKATNLVRHGGHPLTSNPEVKAKKEATLLSRYGCTNVLSNESSVRKRIDDEREARTGYRHAIQNPEAQEHLKRLNLERLGVEYRFQSQEVQQQVTETVKERYGVSSTLLLLPEQKRIQSKISRSPSLDAYNKVIDDEWLINEYVSKEKTCTQIANELGYLDEQSIARRLTRLGIPIVSRQFSVGEREVSNVISALGIEVVNNDRNIVAPKELDIVVPSHRLAIEYCGLYWHSEEYKSANYHQEKMEAANAAGYRLITIFEDEWNNRSDHIKTKLQHILGLSPTRVYARKCTIVDVSSIDKKAFLDRYHIQGNGPSSIQYGLEYEGEIVAVIAFIAKQNGTYTLNRYATSVTVPGGFSKLLKHAITTLPNVSRIETFADLRWSEGHLYESTGFDKEYVIPPDYYWTDGISRWHKFGFRHSLLQSKLEHYDETLTEAQNCHNHGLYRIYDCGKVKYVLTI